MQLNEDKKLAPPSSADMQQASPLRQLAARTGASRREASLGPTQRMLARPDENMEMDDQPENNNDGQ